MDAPRLVATLTMAVAVGSLSAPDPASAEIVTWINRGVIEEVGAQVPPAFAGVAVGDEFELRVTFDTQAPLWATLPFPPGSLYVHDYSSVRMSLTVGAVGPIALAPTAPGSNNPYFGSALYVRDDSGDLASSGYPPALDGISLGLEYASGEGIAVIFRGDVLDLVNGPGLPTNPDRRLTDLLDSFLSVRRFDATGTDPLFVETHFLGRVRSVEAAPGTPPVVTPNISGTLGNGGWYVSDVQLDWTLSDSESAISTSSGCDTSSVNADTAGTSYTCTATSAGGTGSGTATIRRDATPPTATATAGPKANAYGWRRTNVTVTFAGIDAMSGGVTCDPAVILSTEGQDQTASGRCYDAAGNESTVVSASGINIDKTTPTVNFEWNSEDRTVFVSCSDNLSGVRQCDASDWRGIVVTVIASDYAGNVTRQRYRVPW